MTHPLASAWTKLRRGGEHLHVLIDEIQTFFSSNPYTIEAEYDRDAGEADLWVNIWEEPPSLRWGALIGDTVQNYRQALDHIVWVFAEAGTGGTNTTEFPIFRDKAKYLQTERGGGLSKIAGITDEEVRALIQSMQPFDSGENEPVWHPLWTLHELSNIDKHRFMQLVGATLYAQPAVVVALPLDHDRHVAVPGLELKILEWWGGGPFEQHTRLARVEVPADYGHVHINTGSAFVIAFPEGSPVAGKPVIYELSTLAGAAQAVLGDFMPYVPRLS
jgi:hypothetical protein